MVVFYMQNGTQAADSQHILIEVALSDGHTHTAVPGCYTRSIETLAGMWTFCHARAANNIDKVWSISYAQ